MVRVRGRFAPNSSNRDATPQAVIQMPFKQVAIVAAVLCTLGLAGCAHLPNAADEAAQRAEGEQLVARLVSQATPDSLASAALLVPFAGGTRAEGLDLIARAEALAPERAEFVWEERELCENPKCAAAVEIEAHLKAIDPGNGFAWLQDLKRAQANGSSIEVTAALNRMGAGPRITVYWSALEVMLFDALALPDAAQRATSHARSIADRAVRAIGILAAFSLPIRSLGDACQLQNLEEPGRRTACERLVARLEEADTVLLQSYALSIQERWWPAQSTQGEIVGAKRRRLDYVIARSSAVRLRMNHNVAIRVQGARRYAREEEVDIAVLKAYRIPLEPPPGWQDTWHQEYVPPHPAQ